MTAEGAAIQADSFAVERIVAVMSAFNPDSGLASRVEVIASRVRELIIVDDTGIVRDDTQKSASYWSTVELPSNVRLVQNAQNIGIAASLNHGVKEALKQGAEFIFTLDQDTPVTFGLASQLGVALTEKIELGEPFLAAAPETVNGSQYLCQHPVSGSSCSIEVIQSGLLLHHSAFKGVGFFRDDLFIDGVEVEYMIRLHQIGRHVLLVPGLNLTQNLGTHFATRVLGRTITSNNHLPFRRYYITRNRLVLLRLFGRSEPQWARVSTRRLLAQSIKAATIEPARGAKIREMLLGASHALRHKMGRRVAPWK